MKNFSERKIRYNTATRIAVNTGKKEMITYGKTNETVFKYYT